MAHPPARGGRPGCPVSRHRPDRLVSPDGRFQVEADRQYDFRALTIFDAKTDRSLVALDGHPDQLNDGAFAPGGTILATGDGDTAHPRPVDPTGDVRIWDVGTGRLLARLDRHGGAISDVESSPNGGMLATAGYDGTIELWDMAKASPLTGGTLPKSWAILPPTSASSTDLSTRRWAGENHDLWPWVSSDPPRR